eukprot:366150-Chlamydomonas_euryale.AAC.6
MQKGLGLLNESDVLLEDGSGPFTARTMYGLGLLAERLNLTGNGLALVKNGSMRGWGHSKTPKVRTHVRHPAGCRHPRPSPSPSHPCCPAPVILPEPYRTTATLNTGIPFMGPLPATLTDKRRMSLRCTH